MNRYTAAGVLADMREGRRILVLTEPQALARIAFTNVARGVLPGERVRRANGEEEICGEDDRGRVVFSSIRSRRGRGLSVDIVLFDDLHPTPEMLLAVGPNQAASLAAEVIRP